MKKLEGAGLARVAAGAVLGLAFSAVLELYIVGTRELSPVICLLCAVLGAAAGIATLPFADDGKSLLLRSGVEIPAEQAVALQTFRGTGPHDPGHPLAGLSGGHVFLLAAPRQQQDQGQQER